MTANQVVAYNLARARKMAGLSQDQARDRLALYLGTRWSRNVYSAAERSYDGKRVRQFTADDLVAMSLAFSVPVVYFLLPPKPQDRPEEKAALRVGDAEVGWREMFDVMFSGDYRGSLLHRMFELPPEDRPPPRTHAALALDAVASGRATVWDLPPAPYTADDPRLRVAHDGREDS